MTLFWLMFYAALALLFYPSDSALPKHLKFRIYDNLNFEEGSWARQLSTWWSAAMWLDPMRAFAGAWLLIHAWQINAVSDVFSPMVVLIMNTVILGAATAVQLHTRRDTEVLFAPIGYMAGLWFALLSPAVAALAMVVGAGGVIAFRTWSAFFFCGTIYVGIAGLWIMGKDLHVPLSVCLSMLPWVVSAVSTRSLIYPLRANGESRSSPTREIALIVNSRNPNDLKT